MINYDFFCVDTLKVVCSYPLKPAKEGTLKPACEHPLKPALEGTHRKMKKCYISFLDIDLFFDFSHFAHHYFLCYNKDTGRRVYGTKRVL